MLILYFSYSILPSPHPPSTLDKSNVFAAYTNDAENFGSEYSRV